MTFSSCCFRFTTTTTTHYFVIAVVVVVVVVVVVAAVGDVAAAAPTTVTTTTTKTPSITNTNIYGRDVTSSAISTAADDDDVAATTTTATTATATRLEPWQECAIYLAPSSTGGFGVFAARDFEENEIVELAPFFLALNYEERLIRNSALQDYVYGYTRFLNDNRDDSINLSIIVWGMTMWYNHHPTSPNVAWRIFGNEPHPSDYFTHPHVQAVGFFARRNILAGDELFSSYGEDDGGARWFQFRNITMAAVADASSTRADQASLTYNTEKEIRNKYCSKMHAGMDRWLYQHRLRPIQPIDFAHLIKPVERLVPPSAHHHLEDYEHPDYPWAIAKVPIAQGERIELAPALVLDRQLVIGTPLAPLVYYWHDLSDDLQASVEELNDLGYYVVQYQGHDTEWRREGHVAYLPDSVILPAAGWIGRIERGYDVHDMDDEDIFDDHDERRRANCYMKIHASSSMPATGVDEPLSSSSSSSSSTTPFATGNAGIVLELIASRDIAVGERIRVNLPPPASITFKERLALYKEMQQSGQLYAPPIQWNVANEEDQGHRQQEQEESLDEEIQQAVEVNDEGLDETEFDEQDNGKYSNSEL